MDEREWLACTDPAKMLQFLRGKASDRKLRLLACGCCRTVWPLLRKAGRRAVELGEELADGPVDEGLRASVVRAAIEAKLIPVSAGIQDAGWMAHRTLVSDGWYSASWNVGYCGFDNTAMELAVFRDLFGNPFRPAYLNAAWRTTAVMTLAKAIYDDRRFGDLPVLADALEEAGCTDAAVLDHLRGPGPHCRGCHVLDAILGRS